MWEAIKYIALIILILVMVAGALDEIRRIFGGTWKGLAMVIGVPFLIWLVVGLIYG